MFANSYLETESEACFSFIISGCGGGDGSCINIYVPAPAHPQDVMHLLSQQNEK